MKIEQAKTLKLGQAVKCPPDRGSDSYIGHVNTIPDILHEYANTNNVPYIWVSIKDASGNVSIWPSNRISLA